MKPMQMPVLRGLSRAAAVFFLAAGLARAQNYVIDTFDTGVSVANQWWSWWGNGTITWDSTQDANGDPNSGSAYITANTTGQNTYTIARSFGGGPYDNSTPVNLTLFTNLQFWIKWDSANSSMPLSLFNSSGDRLDVFIHPRTNWSGDNLVRLAQVTIPEQASNSWVRIDVPIDPQLSGIEEATGLVFKRWDPSANTGLTMAFWIDNIQLQAVPEPSSWALLVGGGLAMVWFRQKRNARRG
jgi:hypothetical protein